MKVIHQLKAISLSLLFILPQILIAQKGVLTGRIYDATERKAIKQASIRVLDEQGALILSISSGFNGQYLTDSLSEGNYYLEIYAAGYQSVQEQPIRIISDQCTIDVALNTLKKTAETKKENPVVGILSGVLKNYIGQ